MSLVRHLGTFTPNVSMTAEQQWLLGSYLHSFQRVEKNTPCQLTTTHPVFPEKKITYHFMVDHSIIMRQSQSRRNEPCYEIISNLPPLGHGVSGVVHLLEGTLALRTDRSVEFKCANDRVVKVENAADNPADRAQMRKITVSLEARHLHFKRPTSYEKTLYSVMRQLPGRLLFNHLQGASFLNADGVYLMIHLLRAVREQVFANDILHLDIKSDNILVHGDGPYVKVTLFDWSHGMIASDEVPDWQTGAIGYGAPEQFLSQPLCQKTDSYAVGRISADVFQLVDEVQRSNIMSKLQNKEEYTREDAMRDAQRHIRYTFKGNPATLSLSRLHLSQLTATIEGLTHPALQERWTADKALGHILMIPLEIRLNELTEKHIPHDPDNLRNAHTQGMEAYRALYVMKQQRFMSYGMDFSAFKTILTDKMNAFDDEEQAIQLFVETIGHPLFSQARTRSAVLMCVDGLQQRFEQASKKQALSILLAMLRSELQRPIKEGQPGRAETRRALEKERLYLFMDISRYLSRSTALPLSLDDIETFCRKVSKRTALYQHRYSIITFRGIMLDSYPTLKKITEGYFGGFSSPGLNLIIESFGSRLPILLGAWDAQRTYHNPVLMEAVSEMYANYRTILTEMHYQLQREFRKYGSQIALLQREISVLSPLVSNNAELDVLCQALEAWRREWAMCSIDNFNVLDESLLLRLNGCIAHAASCHDKLLAIRAQCCHQLHDDMGQPLQVHRHHQSLTISFRQLLRLLKKDDSSLKYSPDTHLFLLRQHLRLAIDTHLFGAPASIRLFGTPLQAPSQARISALYNLAKDIKKSSYDSATLMACMEKRLMALQAEQFERKDELVNALRTALADFRRDTSNPEFVTRCHN